MENYSHNGSNQLLTENATDTEKTDHEELCESGGRQYSCPCVAVHCQWIGSFDEVLPHLLNSPHSTIPRFKGEHVDISIDINKPSGSCWNIIQFAFGHCFVLFFKIQEVDGKQLFYACPQLIGSRKLAKKFQYCLELKNTTNNNRMIYESKTCSIEEDAITSKDNFVLETICAEKFANCGKLSIDVTVSPCSQ